MLKVLKSFFSILLLSSTFAYASEDTQVYLDGNKINYQGELTQSSNEKTFKIYGENKNNIKWISIKSTGGEVNASLDLAEFINENNLNIEVTEYCLSSCANYIFTAANEKLISKNALIGFHGGTTGMDASVDEFIKTLPESEREITRKNLVEYGKKTSKREAGFFKKINITRDITTLGQSDKYKTYALAADYVGWYYSISGLNKLGVKNISVLNPPWTLKQLSEKSKFFKVEDSDIQ